MICTQDYELPDLQIALNPSKLKATHTLNLIVTSYLDPR